jgi:superfamily II DNA/RNA helicase
MESFSSLGLAESLAQALASFGFAVPTQVQAEAIPVLLSRRDAIIESETGTGKTFAYLAPAFQLVSTLDRKSSGEPGALIAAPTQELAVQIGREAERLAKAADLPLKTVVLLGGTPLDKQSAKLKAKPDIVVGTLGRLADLIALGRLHSSAFKMIVLDEADRLFAPETVELAEALIKCAPSACVRVLVSATIPEKQRRKMRPLLREAVEISPLGDTVLSESIEHWCFYCDGRKRLDFMRRFEAAIHPERCLLFLTMASRVEKVALALDHLGLPIAAIHSGMEKEDRRVALEQFTKGEVRYLLTSDLGARGLDIPGISHVVSLDLPEDGEVVYTHRAGRTGRAGAKGVSIVLADGVELKRASKIATKGGFVFRCKILEEGQVLEPTSEEFFARAGAAEDQRMAAKAAKLGGDEERGAVKRRPSVRSSGGSDSRASDRPRFAKDREQREDTRRDDEKTRRPYPRAASAREEPPEAPRTARAPKVAPWRPAAEGEKLERSGPSIPQLRKKATLREAAPRQKSLRREESQREGSGGPRRPEVPRGDRRDRPSAPPSKVKNFTKRPPRP